VLVRILGHPRVGEQAPEQHLIGHRPGPHAPGHLYLGDRAERADALGLTEDVATSGIDDEWADVSGVVHDHLQRHGSNVRAPNAITHGHGITT
jgi:hypothetical protein